MRIGRKGQRFFFVDFETGGLDPRTAAFYEVGIVITDEWFNVRETFAALILDPDGPLANVSNDEAPAYRVHGITEQERNEKGRPLAAVGSELLVLAERHTSAQGSKPVLVSDCLQFEWQLMARLIAPADIRDVFHFCGWDTSLLLEASGVDDPQPMAHRALADAGLVHRAVVRACERIGMFSRMEGKP